MRPATHWYFGRSREIVSALQLESLETTSIRRATTSDISAMVELSKQRRHNYAQYQPIFWRPAKNAEEKQSDFFRWLLQDDNSLSFVSEAHDGTLNGFLIALQRESLPLTDPALRLRNGLHVDDFTVVRDELWSTAGRDLLTAAVQAHHDRSATDVVINVISGADDHAKRKLLEHDARMSSLFTWDILPASNLYEGSDR